LENHYGKRSGGTTSVLLIATSGASAAASLISGALSGVAYSVRKRVFLLVAPVAMLAHRAWGATLLLADTPE
jgi:hypothetical protein